MFPYFLRGEFLAKGVMTQCPLNTPLSKRSPYNKSVQRFGPDLSWGLNITVSTPVILFISLHPVTH